MLELCISDGLFPQSKSHAKKVNRIYSITAHGKSYESLHTLSENIRISELKLIPPGEQKTKDSKTKCTITIESTSNEVIHKITTNDNSNSVNGLCTPKPAYERVTIEESSDTTNKYSGNTINISYKSQMISHQNKTPASFDIFASGA